MFLKLYLPISFLFCQLLELPSSSLRLGLGPPLRSQPWLKENIIWIQTSQMCICACLNIQTLFYTFVRHVTLGCGIRSGRQTEGWQIRSSVCQRSRLPLLQQGLLLKLTLCSRGAETEPHNPPQRSCLRVDPEMRLWSEFNVGAQWEGQSHLPIVRFFKTMQSRCFKRDDRLPLKFLPTPLLAEPLNSVIRPSIPRVRSLGAYRENTVLSPPHMLSHLIFIICYYPLLINKKTKALRLKPPRSDSW